MAALNTTRTTNLADIKYDQPPWGDLIYGTKEQLQGIGIAPGMNFPGEPGGPKRSFTTVDPRGFRCKVELWSDNIFQAAIHFPNRERPDDSPWKDYSAGVRKRELPYHDEYRGESEALVAAGIVQLRYLPGQPGMNKMRVTILPDGTTPTNSRGQPDAITIERIRKNRFSVLVRVAEEEAEIRNEASSFAKQEWERWLSSIPRPAPLIDLKQVGEAAEGNPTFNARFKVIEHLFKRENAQSEFEWSENNINRTDAILGAFKEAIEAGNFGYTAASQLRIDRFLSELRDAIREGVAVHKVGNIVDINSFRSTR